MTDNNLKKSEENFIPEGCTPMEYLERILVENGIKGLVFDDYDSIDYLRKVVYEKLPDKYSDITDRIRDRVDRELERIHQCNFTDFFLVLRDIANFAKENEILLSPGCGSLPGSIVAFCLGITDVDPVRYDLVFEKFVNEGNAPSVYVETEIGGSRKIEEYVASEYGDEMLKLFEVLDVRFRESRDISIIKETLMNIERSDGHKVDISDIDDKCEAVFESISSGNKVLASFDVPYNNAFLDNQNPKSMEDLCARISLDRPGLEERAEIYNANKNGIGDIKYETPMLKPILSCTYGILIYQEQVIQILNLLGGYSLEQANLLRKNMAKRALSHMSEHKKDFVIGNKDTGIPGCISKGIDEDTASKLFDELVDKTRYTFNKSHAAAYATTLYRMAWLKHYYSEEYTEALKSYIL